MSLPSEIKAAKRSAHLFGANQTIDLRLLAPPRRQTETPTGNWRLRRQSSVFFFTDLAQYLRDIDRSVLPMNHLREFYVVLKLAKLLLPVVRKRCEVRSLALLASFLPGGAIPSPWLGNAPLGPDPGEVGRLDKQLIPKLLRGELAAPDPAADRFFGALAATRYFADG